MGTGEEGGGPKAGSGLHGPEHYISSGREWIWSAVCNHVGNILLKPQVLERRKGGETASDGLSASIADKVFTASQDEGLREGWGGWVKAATGRESQYLKVEWTSRDTNSGCKQRTVQQNACFNHFETSNEKRCTRVPT